MLRRYLATTATAAALVTAVLFTAMSATTERGTPEVPDDSATTLQAIARIATDSCGVFVEKARLATLLAAAFRAGRHLTDYTAVRREDIQLYLDRVQAFRTRACSSKERLLDLRGQVGVQTLELIARMNEAAKAIRGHGRVFRAYTQFRAWRAAARPYLYYAVSDAETWGLWVHGASVDNGRVSVPGPRPGRAFTTVGCDTRWFRKDRVYTRTEEDIGAGLIKYVPNAGYVDDCDDVRRGRVEIRPGARLGRFHSKLAPSKNVAKRLKSALQRHVKERCLELIRNPVALRGRLDAFRPQESQHFDAVAEELALRISAVAHRQGEEVCGAEHDTFRNLVSAAVDAGRPLEVYVDSTLHELEVLEAQTVVDEMAALLEEDLRTGPLAQVINATADSLEHALILPDYDAADLKALETHFFFHPAPSGAKWSQLGDDDIVTVTVRRQAPCATKATLSGSGLQCRLPPLSSRHGGRFVGPIRALPPLLREAVEAGITEVMLCGNDGADYPVGMELRVDSVHGLGGGSGSSVLPQVQCGQATEIDGTLLEASMTSKTPTQEGS